MNITVKASCNLFNYAKLLQGNSRHNRKDMVTTQPDLQKLIHSQNIPDEIPDRNTRTKP